MNKDGVWIDAVGTVGDAGAIFLNHSIDTTVMEESLNAVDWSATLNNDIKEKTEKITKTLMIGISAGTAISALSKAVTQAVSSFNDFNYAIKENTNRSIDHFYGGACSGREAGKLLRREIDKIKYFKALESAGQVVDCICDPLEKHKGKHDPCGLRQNMNLRGRKKRWLK